MGLEFYSMSARCIAVLYMMCKGDPHCKIDKDEFFRQCNQSKVFDMTEEQFKRFKLENIDVAGMSDDKGNIDIWPKN